MGEYIVKLGGKYFLWSTMADAPVAGPFDVEGLKAHVRETRGRAGLADLPSLIERVDQTGTSAPNHAGLDDTVGLNRAGPGGACLSVEQLEALCVRGEEPTPSVFEFVGRRGAPLRVVAYCNVDATAVVDHGNGNETQPEDWSLVGPAPEGVARGVMVVRTRLHKSRTPYPHGG